MHGEIQLENIRTSPSFFPVIKCPVVLLKKLISVLKLREKKFVKIEMTIFATAGI